MISKPRIKKVNDKWSKKSGKKWGCFYGGIVARGETPAHAFNNLKSHLNCLSRLKR